MKVTAANTAMPPLPAAPQGSSHSVPESRPPAADYVAVQRVAVLLTMLENKPNIRQDVVARGRALAADTSYPPPDLIAKLASLVIGDLR